MWVGDLTPYPKNFLFLTKVKKTSDDKGLHLCANLLKNGKVWKGRLNTRANGKDDPYFSFRSIFTLFLFATEIPLCAFLYNEWTIYSFVRQLINYVIKACAFLTLKIISFEGLIWTGTGQIGIRENCLSQIALKTEMYNCEML